MSPTESRNVMEHGIKVFGEYAADGTYTNSAKCSVDSLCNGKYEGDAFIPSEAILERKVDNLLDTIKYDGFMPEIDKTEDGKINFEKCHVIYDMMHRKHNGIVETDLAGAIPLWVSSARTIYADLDKMYCGKEINAEELHYIFGDICSAALMFSHGDFWR